MPIVIDSTDLASIRKRGLVKGHLNENLQLQEIRKAVHWKQYLINIFDCVYSISHLFEEDAYSLEDDNEDNSPEKADFLTRLEEAEKLANTIKQLKQSELLRLRSLIPRPLFGPNPEPEKPGNCPGEPDQGEKPDTSEEPQQPPSSTAPKPEVYRLKLDLQGVCKLNSPASRLAQARQDKNRLNCVAVSPQTKARLRQIRAEGWKEGWKRQQEPKGAEEQQTQVMQENKWRTEECNDRCKYHPPSGNNLAWYYHNHKPEPMQKYTELRLKQAAATLLQQQQQEAPKIIPRTSSPLELLTAEDLGEDGEALNPEVLKRCIKHAEREEANGRVTFESGPPYSQAVAKPIRPSAVQPLANDDRGPRQQQIEEHLEDKDAPIKGSKSKYSFPCKPGYQQYSHSGLNEAVEEEQEEETFVPFRSQIYCRRRDCRQHGYHSSDCAWYPGGQNYLLETPPNAPFKNVYDYRRDQDTHHYPTWGGHYRQPRPRSRSRSRLPYALRRRGALSPPEPSRRSVTINTNNPQDLEPVQLAEDEFSSTLAYRKALYEHASVQDLLTRFGAVVVPPRDEHYSDRQTRNKWAGRYEPEIRINVPQFHCKHCSRQHEVPAAAPTVNLDGNITTIFNAIFNAISTAADNRPEFFAAFLVVMVLILVTKLTLG